MDAVTYPNRKVIDFIQNRLVPLQLASDAEPYATNYGVKWTPSLLIIDAEGKVHHRATGFIPPPQFIAWLLLGIGKAFFEKDMFGEGLECFETVIAEYSYSDSAPEAVFFRGVSQYKSTHQIDGLKMAYRVLQEHYPGSTWANRAYPYWLLP
ncbi:conserved hypothetical protein [Syntrophobacter sp. SbD1]|nr:conserved hypothetical protein [Syntrophobacter sp. SbD1]